MAGANKGHSGAKSVYAVCEINRIGSTDYNKNRYGVIENSEIYLPDKRNQHHSGERTRNIQSHKINNGKQHLTEEFLLCGKPTLG